MSTRRTVARPPGRGLAIAAGALFSVGPMFNGFNDGFGNPLVCLIGAGMLIVLLATHPPRPAFWRQAMPVIGLAAVGVVWATAPVWAPFDLGGVGPLAPDLAGSEVLARIGYVAALLCGCLLARPVTRIAVVDTVLAIGCCAIVLGLLIRAGDTGGWWDLWQARRDGRFTGTLSNANVAGAYFGALAALALSRARSAAPPSRASLASPLRVAHWLALLLALGACVLTASRSATICTAVVLGAMVGWPMLRRRGQVAAIGPAMLVALCVGAVFATGVSELLLDRFGEGGDRSTGRWLIWSHHARVASEAPWFGYGLGSFPALNAMSLGDPRRAQALWTINSPHNMVLHLVLQGGLPYLLTIVVASLWVAAGIVRGLVRDGLGDGRDGIVGAVLIILGCASVDIVLDVPGMVSWWLLMVGTLWSASATWPGPHRGDEPGASAGEAGRNRRSPDRARKSGRAVPGAAEPATPPRR